MPKLHTNTHDVKMATLENTTRQARTSARAMPHEAARAGPCQLAALARSNAKDRADLTAARDVFTLQRHTCVAVLRDRRGSVRNAVAFPTQPTLTMGMSRRTAALLRTLIRCCAGGEYGLIAIGPHDLHG